jgi:hypothetical protein
MSEINHTKAIATQTSGARCSDCELPPHQCCCKERAAYLVQFRRDREQVIRKWEQKLSREVPATDMGEQHPFCIAVRDQIAVLKYEVARQMFNEFMVRSHPHVRPWKRGKPAP